MKVYRIRYKDILSGELLCNSDSYCGKSHFSRQIPARRVTLGSFDGLHVGHKLLADKLSEEPLTNSSDRQLKSLITFYPHPAKIISGRRFSKPFYSLSSKTKILKDWGFDELLLLHFDRQFLNLSPDEFIEKVLIDAFNIKQVVIGEDWKFGKGAGGDAQYLVQYCKERSLDVDVTIIEDFKKLDSESGELRRVSSGWLRELLESGRVDDLNTLLGRVYFVCGVVSHGDKRGGELLGIKTANLHIGSTLQPKNGVYAGYVEAEGEVLKAVINIGITPTFKQSSQVKLEAHILDKKNINLYGKKIKVMFSKRLRDEIKFNSYEDLLQQIKKDIEQTRQILKE